MSTKAEALKAAQESGGTAKQQQRILYWIGLMPGLTRNELACKSGIRLSSVCARVNELSALIDSERVRRCSVTGRTAHTLYLKSGANEA